MEFDNILYIFNISAKKTQKAEREFFQIILQ